jgi:hypothetical protein
MRMATLVERLRNGPELDYGASEWKVVYDNTSTDALLEEAADRIEALERALSKIQNTLYEAAP